ncbi:MAG: hypothetical protein NC421_00210 [Lachnospiraceae bacterium]|nr:hypothetical protein [Lachnospiraceae bacterium]
MKRLFSVIIACAVVAVMALDADTRTTRGKLKAAVKDNAEFKIEEVDTLQVIPADSLSVSGYDKALRSGRESLRVANRYSRRVGGVVIDIVYRGVNGGEMLHARRLRLSCDIPSGETRQLEWSAWDKQNRYYYHDTRVTPRSVKAVPYQVDIFPREVKFADEKD